MYFKYEEMCNSHDDTSYVSHTYIWRASHQGNATLHGVRIL